MTQKFFTGDLVEITHTMPPSMSHFPGNCEAIVLHSYAEAHGGSGRAEKQYCLYLLLKGNDRGEAAWYMEDQLTLIKANRFDLLPKSHIARRVWEAKKARQTWVNLTEQEIGELYNAGWANNMDFARAIEAKVKEKNHG